MARNRCVLILTLLLCTLGLVAATLPPPEEQARQGAARHAHALRTTDPAGDLADLRPLGRMVGDAKVVGLGEATHSSHEFFTMKHRVLRYLVEEKGFRAFALETAWSTGLRLDAYVRTGEGDPRRIMREEFQDTYAWWNTKEYLALVEWIREWNTDHPKDQVRFLGDDFAYAGPELYDRVLRYAALHQPRLLPRLAELYRGLRPTTSSGTYMKEYLTRSLPERRALATRTTAALALLTRNAPSSGPAAEARAWALQHARAIDQTARGYAFDFDDPEDLRASMGYRDQLMADNVAWWHEQTGDKILLSAHNSHLAYRSADPRYPKMQGAFLRDRLGTAYLSAAMTFGTGSFNATGRDGATTLHTLKAPARNTTEHFLNSVTPTDYYLDLRTAPTPTRTWLSTPRPTRNIGTAYPEPPQKVAPAHSHDVVMHLHRVTGAGLLATPE
ncbi:erythromycin esterase family protein [Streptomyces sp. GF20]|uniref:erythromycin esterase family protein n=2 Tax=Streptomyces TaxID=1883 RepID=UPI0010201DF9|nr:MULTISPECIES: erythromycin esterase family protein [Streptomyces]QHC18445.1 erythromycin esterase family protein [Streptomyces sp. GF20]RZD67614.1 erythromycin esterase [Streptomyces albidoflavus]